ncbi:hypothetical protein [Aliivibrio fischeri]|uniref:hypothetical protein n=1 Tax=Aliivibrio fischeri TaxID=668 RepID=UPI00084C58F2|nr:hypothetical protein [Aliivibrio fischeri]OED51243.1 hypothetical protein BEI47_20140 [Aliivibrio fischeri]
MIKKKIINSLAILILLPSYVIASEDDDITKMTINQNNVLLVISNDTIAEIAKCDAIHSRLFEHSELSGKFQQKAIVELSVNGLGNDVYGSFDDYFIGYKMLLMYQQGFLNGLKESYEKYSENVGLTLVYKKLNCKEYIQ